ncbi:ATP-binding protein [cf. Phormidesmis sp. LEGE 11477]|uniref:ATP-binding protein n=1 Tax=cf. Phormidesmis sp. LEGE 11477 TaxID=1828680 RepID=UPI00187FD7A5|nr:ATP-binding protein [cf. Phormidesmis sp. LEGE 11477]MBE9062401.1 ATP-binding protein [cf. Phormidesmis sp. LEGE 11477]
MNLTKTNQNADCIDRELTWFSQILEHRFQLRADGKSAERNVFNVIPPPALPQTDVSYANLLQTLNLQPAERLVLILSLIPHIKPNLLDTFLVRNQSLDRGYTEFGGLIGNAHGGFLPTCETAMFLLADDNLSARLHYDGLFKPDQGLFAQGILSLNHQHTNEPPLSAALHLTPEYRQRIITGQSYTPTFSSAFPAQRITTDLAWDDLVLDPATRQEIDDILTWIQNKDLLMNSWNLKQRIKPGFRSLFYGPPGTGKTMTACLLGKKSGLPVFRIDLSRVVSKYIGETEKNLARLFDRAQHQDWILFFDEADSLFGKRVESQNSNDRAANQEISYLLQRIEDYRGLAILATNLRTHLDEAFARRFQSMIHFPIPNTEQRLQLWRDTFLNKPFEIAEEIDFDKLATEYELTGGNIINVLRYACLKAVTQTPQKIYEDDLLEGISRELQKEGRVEDKASRRYLGMTYQN